MTDEPEPLDPKEAEEMFDHIYLWILIDYSFDRGFGGKRYMEP